MLKVSKEQWAATIMKFTDSFSFESGHTTLRFKGDARACSGASQSLEALGGQILAVSHFVERGETVLRIQEPTLI